MLADAGIEARTVGEPYRAQSIAWGYPSSGCTASLLVRRMAMDIRALLKQGSSLEELEQSLLDLDSEFDFKSAHCGQVL